MADLRPFLVMNEVQAARYRADTLGREFFIDPRYIEAGPHKGKYGIGAGVLQMEEHKDLWPVLRMLTEVGLDIDIAWPVVEVLKAEAV